ncbi:hypothetical protein chiPu_0026677, partial [Chiloscyllium punctatum]|nr:hypothetical protein [Chiloscyllium punctatum]
MTSPRLIRTVRSNEGSHNIPPSVLTLTTTPSPCGWSKLWIAPLNMVTTEPLEIDSCQLMHLLVEAQMRPLVLDCRSFLHFNASHIRGSHNVHCNSIVKRRSKGAITLDCILAEESVRAGLRGGRYPTVVVL